MKPLQIRTLAIAVIVGLLISSLSAANQQTLARDERQLSFYHTLTGKRLIIVYSRKGEYIPLAIEEINNFLFDFRTGDKAEMDAELLDLIYDVREAHGRKSEPKAGRLPVLNTR